MAAKQYFRPWLIRHMKDESENHDQCIAFSIYVGSDPIARIECTAHLDERYYELVFFYTYYNYSKSGIGSFLLETAEKAAKEYGAESIIVTPIRMMDSKYAHITDEELITIYEHLGFSWVDGCKIMKKKL